MNLLKTARAAIITILAIPFVIVIGYAILFGLIWLSLSSMASDRISDPVKVVNGINDDWNADIPSGYSVDLAFKDTGFDGGEYYLVLKYETQPTEFCSRLETQPSDFVEEFIDGNLDNYNRANREMPFPDWDSGYLWKYFRAIDNSFSEYSDELYLVYSPTSNLLYVYLDFSQYSGRHEYN